MTSLKNRQIQTNHARRGRDHRVVHELLEYRILSAGVLEELLARG